MRNSRQNKILEIITNNEIETQEQLISKLQDEGYKATASTICRDIKDLQIIKRQSRSGKTVYSADNFSDSPISNRFINIFNETILSYASANNLIIVKTLSGCGSAAGEAIDCLGLEHIVGSVSGDNTMLIVVDSSENVPEILELFDKMIKGQKIDND